MTISEFIGAFSIFIELAGVFYTYTELSATFVFIRENKKINGGYRHTIEHALLLLLIIVCNLSLLFWLITHKGVSHAWHTHVLDENFWVVILLFGILKISVSKHLRDERKGII